MMFLRVHCNLYSIISTQNVNADILPLITNRGPDSCETHQLTIKPRIPDNVDSLVLTFFGSVLHLRGQNVTRQPLVNKEGDVLLWNGEIFGGIEVYIYFFDFFQ